MIGRNIRIMNATQASSSSCRTVPGSMMTILHSAAEASDSAALRDVGPAIIRAQCAADPVQVAREIVRAKIAADVKGLGPRVTPAMPRDDCPLLCRA